MRIDIRPYVAVLALSAVWTAGRATAALTYNDDASLTIGIESGTLTVGNNAVSVDGTYEGSFYLGAITLQGSVFGNPASFSSVCTDLRGVVYVGTTYQFSDQQYNGLLQGLNPKWGDDNASSFIDQASASAAIQNAADIFAKHNAASAYGSATRAQWWAAIQLSVWDALYNTKSDGTIDTSSTARFKISSGAVDSTVLGLVSSWLQPAGAHYAGDILVPIIPGSSPTGWVPDGPPSASPGAQGMLYDVTPVPEPTTLIAGALLLLPFGASTLRVLRKHRAA